MPPQAQSKFRISQFETVLGFCFLYFALSINGIITSCLLLQHREPKVFCQGLWSFPSFRFVIQMHPFYYIIIQFNWPNNKCFLIWKQNSQILIFHCYAPVDNEESTWMKSSPAQIHFTNGVPTSSTPMHTLGGTRRVISYSSKVPVGAISDLPILCQIFSSVNPISIIGRLIKGHGMECLDYWEVMVGGEYAPCFFVYFLYNSNP